MRDGSGVEVELCLYCGASLELIAGGLEPVGRSRRASELAERVASARPAVYWKCPDCGYTRAAADENLARSGKIARGRGLNRRSL